MSLSRKELDAIKEIANKNIAVILDSLQVTYTERYSYLCGPCPIHKGRNPGAFSWHVDMGLYQCFSRGCHTKHGKDIFGLVSGITGCSFMDAVEYVKKTCQIEKVDVDTISQRVQDKKFVDAINKKNRPFKTFPEESLKKLRYHIYLETRGYPKELIESYQIGISGDEYKKMSNRIIIPVRNINGQIVGFTGRTLYEDWKERNIGKWENNSGFDKENNLFNIDRAAPFIRETGVAILTEGPLDVLRLEQAGIHNSVAIFGRKLHNGQIGLLLSCCASTLVLALDNDVAGQTGIEDAIRTAKNFFAIKRMNVGEKDVGEMSIEQIRGSIAEIEKIRS